MTRRVATFAATKTVRSIDVDESSTQKTLTSQDRKRANFKPGFVEKIEDHLGLKWSQVGLGDLAYSVGPESVIRYIYSILYSPTYRNRYKEFLKIDFPRLPMPGNLELFRVLARLGGKLVTLHLMNSSKLDEPITTLAGSIELQVEKISYSNDTVWLDQAKTCGFQGISEAVWNFHIGGYQVCDKWLKDRKGRTLSDEDIAHYQKIIVALHETIRLMQEIDEVIDQHGGWPGAFVTATGSTA